MIRFLLKLSSLEAEQTQLPFLVYQASQASNHPGDPLHLQFVIVFLDCDGAEGGEIGRGSLGATRQANGKTFNQLAVLWLVQPMT